MKKLKRQRKGVKLKNINFKKISIRIIAILLFLIASVYVAQGMEVLWSKRRAIGFAIVDTESVEMLMDYDIQSIEEGRKELFIKE